LTSTGLAVGSVSGGEGSTETLSLTKVAKPNGAVVKKRDILAHSDKDALDVAARDQDCPICDVYHAGEKIGSIV
jgi:hypothetical protein